jgi:hypothetical protein
MSFHPVDLPTIRKLARIRRQQMHNALVNLISTQVVDYFDKTDEKELGQIIVEAKNIWDTIQREGMRSQPQIKHEFFNTSVLDYNKQFPQLLTTDVKDGRETITFNMFSDAKIQVLPSEKRVTLVVPQNIMRKVPENIRKSLPGGADGDVGTVSLNLKLTKIFLTRAPVEFPTLSPQEINVLRVVVQVLTAAGVQSFIAPHVLQYFGVPASATYNLVPTGVSTDAPVGGTRALKYDVGVPADIKYEGEEEEEAGPGPGPGPEGAGARKGKHVAPTKVFWERPPPEPRDIKELEPLPLPLSGPGPDFKYPEGEIPQKKPEEKMVIPGADAPSYNYLTKPMYYGSQVKTRALQADMLSREAEMVRQVGNVVSSLATRNTFNLAKSPEALFVDRIRNGVTNFTLKQVITTIFRYVKFAEENIYSFPFINFDPLRFLNVSLHKNSESNENRDNITWLYGNTAFPFYNVNYDWIKFNNMNINKHHDIDYVFGFSPKRKYSTSEIRKGMEDHIIAYLGYAACLVYPYEKALAKDDFFENKIENFEIFSFLPTPVNTENLQTFLKILHENVKDQDLLACRVFAYAIIHAYSFLKFGEVIFQLALLHDMFLTVTSSGMSSISKLLFMYTAQKPLSWVQGILSLGMAIFKSDYIMKNDITPANLNRVLYDILNQMQYTQDYEAALKHFLKTFFSEHVIPNALNIGLKITQLMHMSVQTLGQGNVEDHLANLIASKENIDNVPSGLVALYLIGPYLVFLDLNKNTATDDTYVQLTSDLLTPFKYNGRRPSVFFPSFQFAQSVFHPETEKNVEKGFIDSKKAIPRKDLEDIIGGINHNSNRVPYPFMYFYEDFIPSFEKIRTPGFNVAQQYAKEVVDVLRHSNRSEYVERHFNEFLERTSGSDVRQSSHFASDFIHPTVGKTTPAKPESGSSIAMPPGRPVPPPGKGPSDNAPPKPRIVLTPPPTSPPTSPPAPEEPMTDRPSTDPTNFFQAGEQDVKAEKEGKAGDIYLNADIPFSDVATKTTQILTPRIPDTLEQIYKAYNENPNALNIEKKAEGKVRFILEGVQSPPEQKQVLDYIKNIQKAVGKLYDYSITAAQALDVAVHLYRTKQISFRSPQEMHKVIDNYVREMVEEDDDYKVLVDHQFGTTINTYAIIDDIYKSAGRLSFDEKKSLADVIIYLNKRRRQHETSKKKFKIPQKPAEDIPPDLREGLQKMFEEEEERLDQPRPSRRFTLPSRRRQSIEDIKEEIEEGFEPKKKKKKKRSRRTSAARGRKRIYGSGTYLLNKSKKIKKDFNSHGIIDNTETTGSKRLQGLNTLSLLKNLHNKLHQTRKTTATNKSIVNLLAETQRRGIITSRNIKRIRNKFDLDIP